MGLGGLTHDAVITNHLRPFLDLANHDMEESQHSPRLLEGGAKAVGESFGFGSELRPGSFEPEKGMLDTSEVESSGEKQKEARSVRFAPPNASVETGPTVMTTRQVHPTLETLDDVDSADSNLTDSWVHISTVSSTCSDKVFHGVLTRVLLCNGCYMHHITTEIVHYH